MTPSPGACPANPDEPCGCEVEGWMYRGRPLTVATLRDLVAATGPAPIPSTPTPAPRPGAPTEPR